MESIRLVLVTIIIIKIVLDNKYHIIYLVRVEILFLGQIT